MPFRLKVEVLGEAAFNAALIGVTERVEDMRPVWETVTPLVFGFFTEQFDSEGAAGSSGKWQKLTAKYDEVKRRRWGEKKILEASGALRAAMTGKTENTLIDITRNEAGWGTSLKYAYYHQRGSPKTNLPRRPIVALSDGQTRRLAKGVQLALLDEIKKDRRVTPFFGTTNNLLE